jgi:hypothetical protein
MTDRRSLVRRTVARVLNPVRPKVIAYRRGLRDRERVSKIVHARAAGVVQRGPFRGMRLTSLLTDTSSKVLGSYEEELHETLVRLLTARPEQIVNVGCSDGYYAVGCKLRLPSANVWAFDASEYFRGVVATTAGLNGVDVNIGGFLEPQGLEGLVLGHKTLVICDCEGCEYALLHPRAAPSLRDATLLVELHEEPGQPEEFLERFSATHRTTLIESQPRNAGDYHELDGLPDHDRSLAVFERPFTMTWAVLEPNL